MANELMYTVNKDATAKQNAKLKALLYEANVPDERSTYKALSDAYRALNIATGFYQVLDGLGLLDERDMVGEDIKRVEKKIQDILDEKRRKDVPRWKH